MTTGEITVPPANVTKPPSDETVSPVAKAAAKVVGPKPELGEEVFYVLGSGDHKGESRLAKITYVHTKESVKPELADAMDECGYVSLSVCVGTPVDFAKLKKLAVLTEGVIPGTVFQIGVRYDASGAPETWHRKSDRK